MPDEWYEPEPGEANPLTAQPVEQAWPLDPLRGRAEIEAGAALVRAAMAAGAVVTDSDDEQVREWRRDVDVLLAERRRRVAPETVEVELPAQLSVSQLVELERDPLALARRLHRPVPSEPAPWARRGTAVHEWLERRWAMPTLLDLDELPGSSDDRPADDSQLVALQQAFEASPWAARTPTHVEVPFEMAIGTTVVRGRMDAVFGSGGPPANDGVVGGGESWHVVDWKTGSKPTGAAAQAAAIQLAAYRLAWARLNDIPDDKINSVQASFHYVGSNDTVSPTLIYGVNELTADHSGMSSSCILWKTMPRSSSSPLSPVRTNPSSYARSSPAVTTCLAKARRLRWRAARGRRDGNDPAARPPSAFRSRDPQ